MIYPYYCPNLNLQTYAESVFFSTENARNSLVSYFSNLTGKKYILITNSCRTALFLAYSSLEHKGEVTTSPLTCKVAIDPIIDSGNTAVFADIRISDLNIDPGDIRSRINDNTIAIQAIHLGGTPCDMDPIMEIAKKNDLIVIEDCAQSLGSIYKGHICGSIGDVACFSLIKNAYGIGGGILATNNERIFLKAEAIQSNFRKPAKSLIYYRLLRNLAESYRNSLGNLLLKVLFKTGKGKTHDKSLKSQLRMVSPVEIRVAAAQIKRFPKLHAKRKALGIFFSDQLIKEGLMHNNRFNSNESSFTKLFVYNPEFSTNVILRKLHNHKIEAMHLEQKRGSPVQEKLTEEKENLYDLPVYGQVHDHLISLPLSENFSFDDVNSIIGTLKSIKHGQQ